MKLSAYIKELQLLLDTSGDHEVTRSLPYAPMSAFSRDVRIPALMEVREKGKREHYEKYTGMDSESKPTGERVYSI